MAKAQTSPGYKGLIVYLGEGSDPVTFTAPCALAQQALELEKETVDENVPDCDDPSLPASRESVVETMGFRVTGEGLMAEQSVDIWDDAYESVDPVPVRVDVIKASGAIIRRESLAHVTISYNRPSDKGKVRMNVTVASDGPVTRTKVAAPGP